MAGQEVPWLDPAQDSGTAELTPPPDGQDKTPVRELGETVFRALAPATPAQLPAKPPGIQTPFLTADAGLADPLLRQLPLKTFRGRPRPMLGGIPILGRLGQGGMGAVYYAEHPRLQLEVAVKVLSPELAAQYAELVQRFNQEAQLAARIKSPHLVGVLDVNEDAGLYYLVMEYVDGQSAEQWVRRLPMAALETDVLDLGIAICTGLAAAHEAGVVHRDVKPSNFLIPYMHGARAPALRQAKLADLGIACLEDRVQTLTRASSPMGSPGYMAPEQVMDSAHATTASDIFGLGAALYALLARGQAPFMRATYGASLLAAIKEPHAPLRELRPDVSPATAALLDRCLAKAAAARHATGAELLDELRACRAALEAGPAEQLAQAERIRGAANRASALVPAVPQTERKLAVLCVEDNEAERCIMEHLLKRMPWPLDVRLFESAREALAAAERERPDLILTDICMPDLDGYEFIERVRALPGLELTPIVVKSSISQDIGQRRSLHIGADAYLQKPVSREDLERTLARMIRRNSEKPAG